MPEEIETIAKLCWLYVAKIVVGLVLVGAGILAAFSLPFMASEVGRWLVLGGLLLAAVGAVPLASRFYRRSDELHQSVHQQACTNALPVLFSVFAVVGILQAGQLLPDINGFAAMSLVLAVWGVNLVLSDRRYRP